LKSVSDIHKELSGTFEVDLGTVHHFSDGLYAKQMLIPKGYVAGSHSHEYSHMSILAKGHVIVSTDTSSTEYAAPACIEIVKHTLHNIEALEDSVWFCVHATEETNLKLIDNVLIGKK
jgi:quercetin dioxygenase-like cupin family protein